LAGSEFNKEFIGFVPVAASCTVDSADILAVDVAADDAHSDVPTSDVAADAALL